MLFFLSRMAIMRFLPLAGHPWRLCRQGSGFDSPWRCGGGTGALLKRAPVVVEHYIRCYVAAWQVNTPPPFHPNSPPVTHPSAHPALVAPGQQGPLHKPPPPSPKCWRPTTQEVAHSIHIDGGGSEELVSTSRCWYVPLYSARALHVCSVARGEKKRGEGKSKRRKKGEVPKVNSP